MHELAGELLALYALRQTRTRPPLGDEELDGAARGRVPVRETEDQGGAIDAVKQDLEASSRWTG